MASNVYAEVITLHNKMVFNISTEIFGETLEVVKELFRNKPLNSADMSGIKNIPSLFKRLRDYETIEYGDYQKFVSTIKFIHPRVCLMVQEYSEKIKTLQGNLDDQGPSPGRQPKTEDQSQQQSTETNSYTGEPVSGHLSREVASSYDVHHNVESPHMRSEVHSGNPHMRSEVHSGKPHMRSEVHSGNPHMSTVTHSSDSIVQVQSSIPSQEQINLERGQLEAMEYGEKTTSPKIALPEKNTDSRGCQTGDRIPNTQTITAGASGPEIKHFSGEAVGKMASAYLQGSNTEVTTVAVSQTQGGATGIMVPANPQEGTTMVQVQKQKIGKVNLSFSGEASVIGDNATITINRTVLDDEAKALMTGLMSELKQTRDGQYVDQRVPPKKSQKTSGTQTIGDLAAKNVTIANASHAKKIHSDLEPMIETTKAKIREEKEKKFYHTKGFRDAKDKLQKNRVVVIKGNTGDEDTYRLLAQKYKVTDDCVVPVKDASNQEELIIIYDPSCNTERRLKEFGHDVIIRNQKYVSTEGAIVSSICKTEQYSIRPEDRNNLKQTLNHHMKRLFASHSNLNIITTSPVKSKNKGDDIIEGPCIVLVCSSKGYIPNGESKFPKELIFEKTTYMVDVREGYFQFSPYSTNSSSHFHQNIKMGCSFGIEGTTNAGTVGPFVDSQGHQLFLTCAHIVNGVDPKGYYLKNIQNMFAEQPDAMTFCESSQRCGEVRRAVFLPDNNPSSVDAAVVQITEQSRIPSRGEFAIDSKLNFKAAGFDDLPRFESGEIHDDPDTLDIDLRIVKFGAKTHATRGVISSHGTAARPLTTNLGLLGQPNMCVMKNQIEVFSLEGHSHFFSPGDSGSGVFVVNKLSTGEQKLTCIGLAIGCTSYGSAVVTPIAAVLDALGLPRRLKQFP